MMRSGCLPPPKKVKLQMQRKMPVAKKERMERLIAGIDDILKALS